MYRDVKPIPGSVIYLSHGGGPLPLLGDKSHQEMIDIIKEMAQIIPKPKAIVVISAHWEAQYPTITSGAFPSLIYDYYGFPKESYEITYPAPGASDLAQQLFYLLSKAGIKAKLDQQRGFDHGLFVPLKIMYPDATIPCIQLSLVSSLNPEEHIQMGKAIASIIEDNILVIGSGFSFHNLKAFFSPSTPSSKAKNDAFEDWLNDTLTNKGLTEKERYQRLIHWENAPSARYCHPREEHLLPLQVCYGIAGKAANKVFKFEILGKMASAFLW
jgi:aromatic ring-opening dioxygenase catalytic subunit (LigB family)